MISKYFHFTNKCLNSDPMKMNENIRFPGRNIVFKYLTSSFIYLIGNLTQNTDTTSSYFLSEHL